ncbi:hypothetical protein D3C87_81460 [compost metagenome]
MSVKQQIANILDAQRQGAKFFMTDEGRERFLNMIKEEYDPAAESWVEKVIGA